MLSRRLNGENIFCEFGPERSVHRKHLWHIVAVKFTRAENRSFHGAAARAKEDLLLCGSCGRGLERRGMQSPSTPAIAAGDGVRITNRFLCKATDALVKQHHYISILTIINMRNQSHHSFTSVRLSAYIDHRRRWFLHIF